MIPNFSHFSFAERLTSLRLCTLKYRRSTVDLVTAAKIVFDDFGGLSNLLITNDRRETRGHVWKLIKPSTRIPVHHRFATRVINEWNALRCLDTSSSISSDAIKKAIKAEKKNLRLLFD